MPFEQTQFIDFAKEYINPDLSSWQLYIENSEFKVYRRTSPRNSSLFEYRIIGGWKDVPAHILSHVYLDLAYRKKWDKYMISFQDLGSNSLHYLIKYPWPLSNRDYIYEIQRYQLSRKDGQKLYAIIGDSITDPQITSKVSHEKGVVTIDNYAQSIVIADDGTGGSRVLMDYFDDPKGNIPTAVINWAAKTGVPGFMKSLRQACIKFEKENPGFQTNVTRHNASAKVTYQPDLSIVADRDPNTNVQKGTRFEYCTQTALLQHFGMHLQHFGGRGDGGIDLRGIWPLSSVIHATFSPQELVLFVQCKDHKKGVSPENIRSLIGAVVDQQHSEKSSIGILASPFTQKGFTKQVIKTFDATQTPLGLVLIDGLTVTDLVFNEAAKDIMPGVDIMRRFIDENRSEPVITYNGKPVNAPPAKSSPTCL
ncbi:hypothetical protein INT43_005938 [Umbelopsis isabellina]|uniref:Phosphatidylcholine transfer protein n=1 Tax=Mortierella isabellina TaxID=91625 RepID=A0A8H7U7V2_MORIS|nr:hypothetical protein INT43_005938 [Umbelopsis isabellina]